MAMTAYFGGVRRAIGVNNRRGWLHSDFQGSKMINLRNFGKGVGGGTRLREDLCVSANNGTNCIGIRGNYEYDDNGFHAMVDGMDGNNGDRETMADQQVLLDRWLHNSIDEIVKNVGEGPLLVHIYTENYGTKDSKLSSTKMRLVMEKATSESWTNLKHRWEKSSYTIPNGIILVEELSGNKQQTIGTNTTTQQKNEDNNNNNTSCLEFYNASYNSNNNNSSSNMQKMESSSSCCSPATRLWGVLVQGKGVNFPASYVLKTCQVKCCFGSSTHFCLAKVDCFGKNNVDYYLNNCWLQR
ncbi:uncharacterized protein LOC104900518 [Beta vulgaris subsp. vulgaris]|uniref:uncharacterized protein LOC104900518 n=1 Tax=Beta vulgaris subsp. vulgaris TaxID=3555 RepID=UPI0020374E1E|nr:uncharacterized protein LOC104900518 [Beta vulgaris subsp. vulgaris]